MDRDFRSVAPGHIAPHERLKGLLVQVRDAATEVCRRQAQVKVAQQHLLEELGRFREAVRRRQALDRQLQRALAKQDWPDLAEADDGA